MPTITPEDIEEIQYPSDTTLDEMTIEEVVKVHFRAWRSVEQNEVYSTRQMQVLLESESLLQDIGVEFDPSFPQYHVPAGVME